MTIRIDDVIITIAYVWIPVQIVVAFARYPRLTDMPPRFFGLAVLVGLFFILCGTGHFLRALGYHQGQHYNVLNWMTALVSMVAALYSLPLIPTLVSSLDQNLEDLVKLNHETAESKRKLLQFMSFLCHEIRNPLFAITSAITFLGEDTLTEDQETTVETISESAELMLRLVNDVLDISKLESGKLEVEEREFDLKNLLQGIFATANTQIKRKHGHAVEFRCSIASNVPHRVSSDSVRLSQIVYNLLTNANKFTETGCIEYNVSICDFSQAVEAGLIEQASILDDQEAEDHGDDNICESETSEFTARLIEATEEGRAQKLHEESNTVALCISVADTGCGIASDRLTEIFLPYSQAKMSDYRKFGGTGLGLSIVSNLTRIMGGTIQVSSKENEGSTFVVYLPMRKCHEKQLDLSLSEDASAAPKEADRAFFNLDTLISCPEVPSRGFYPLTPDPGKGIHVDRMQPVAETFPRSPLRKKRPKGTIPKIFNLSPIDHLVLVVDDNMMNRKLIGRMLSNFNIEYETACNGQEALDVMAKSRNTTNDPHAPRFSLIFMDMQMPVLNGVEAIEELRAQGLTLPIIALTANALDEWKRTALQAGATDFATKPILRDDLYAKCCQYLLA